MESYATTQDLEKIWRTLQPDEETKADELLKQASNYLRLVSKNSGKDLDERIKDDESGLFKENLKAVVLQAVKRAMTMPQDMPEVDSWSMSASPYSESMRYVNPNNDIYFKKSELGLLGISSVSGKSKIGILRGAR